MDDLEAIRQRRLRELQEQQAAAQDPAAEAAAEEEAARAEAAIESLLQQILTPEARERLTRIRMSRPELAAAVTRQLVTLAESGRLQTRVDDAALRQYLATLSPQDRDIRITRK